MTTRVRPITVMAAAAVVVLASVGVFAWTRDDSTVVGQPAALPILVGARADAAVAPASTTDPTRTYVAGPGLVDPGGDLAAWSVTAGGPDPVAIRRLADAFGVSGDLRRVDGAWQIGADGAAAVRVLSSAGAGWTYSPDGHPMVGVVCAEPATRSAAGGCEPTPAPEGVPTEAEAEAGARDLLHRAGLDVGHMKVSATSAEWGAQVVATPELGGTSTQGHDTVIAFGAHAAVTYASGWLAEPTRGDTYPLIGLDAAIGRLNDGQDLLGGFAPVPAIADGAAVTPGSGGGTETTVPEPPTTIAPSTTWACPVPSCPANDACTYACAAPTCDPAACQDPHPGPTVVPHPADLPPVPPRPTVTIISADLVLAAEPGSDGSLWFVPAYRLTGDDGSTSTVLGVDESFVAPPGSPPVSAPVGTAVPPEPSCTAPWMC